MICPKCEYEYIDGVETCPDCNETLIPVKDFEGNLVHHEDWVVVYSTSDQIEAEMLKSNLAGADIESLILSQKDRNYPGVGDLAVVKLLTKKVDSAEAVTIIDDINKTDKE